MNIVNNLSNFITRFEILFIISIMIIRIDRYPGVGNSFAVYVFCLFVAWLRQKEELHFFFFFFLITRVHFISIHLLHSDLLWLLLSNEPKVIAVVKLTQQQQQCRRATNITQQQQ